MPKDIFDVGGFMKSQGLEFVSKNDDGSDKYISNDGEDVDLDTVGFLKSQKIPVSQLDLEYNTPDAAIDVSPVSITDRAKLSLDKPGAQLKYYKSKFDDAAISEDQGLVVKKGGVWHKVDSSSMDPYEIAADVAEGGISFIPSLLAGSAGTAAGVATTAATGNPIAGVAAGAGVAGAVAGGSRLLLGKILGTGERNPEEELKEAGWETVINAAGYPLSLAAKPVMGVLTKAASKLKSVPEAAKSVIAEVFGRMTGAGAKEAGIYIEEAPAVGKQVAQAVTKFGETGAKEGLMRSGIDQTKRMVEQVPAALSKKFRGLVDELAESAPENFSVNLSEIAKGAEKILEDAGIGKMSKKAGTELAEGLIDAGGRDVAPKVAGGTFRILSNKESLKRIVKGQTGNLLDDESAASVSKMFGILGDISKAGVAKGPTGARALMELNRAMNQSARTLADRNVDPTVAHFVGEVRKAVSLKIGQKFADNGMHDAFKATANLYEKYADSASYARTLMSDVTGRGMETLYGRINSGIGKNFAYQDIAKDMSELLGEEGKAMLKNISITDVASKFVSVFPKSTLSNLTAGGAGVYAAGAGMVSPLTAAAGVAMSSPRLVGAGIQAASKASSAIQASRAFPYAKKTADFIGSLPPKARDAWLKNPAAVQATFAEALKGFQSEEQQTEELLTSAGVK